MTSDHKHARFTSLSPGAVDRAAQEVLAKIGLMNDDASLTASPSAQPGDDGDDLPPISPAVEKEGAPYQASPVLEEPAFAGLPLEQAQTPAAPARSPSPVETKPKIPLNDAPGTPPTLDKGWHPQPPPLNSIVAEGLLYGSGTLPYSAAHSGFPPPYQLQTYAGMPAVNPAMAHVPVDQGHPHLAGTDPGIPAAYHQEAYGTEELAPQRFGDSSHQHGRQNIHGAQPSMASMDPGDDPTHRRGGGHLRGQSSVEGLGAAVNQHGYPNGFAAPRPVALSHTSSLTMEQVMATASAHQRPGIVVDPYPVEHPTQQPQQPATPMTGISLHQIMPNPVPDPTGPSLQQLGDVAHTGRQPDATWDAAAQAQDPMAPRGSVSYDAYLQPDYLQGPSATQSAPSTPPDSPKPDTKSIDPNLQSGPSSFTVEVPSRQPTSELPLPVSTSNSKNGHGRSVSLADSTGVKVVSVGGVPPPARGPPKKSHARKQPEGHIPRPRNAFILFRKHITDNNLIPTTVEVKHQNISIVASKMWAEAPPEVKAEFNEAARIEKEEHARMYPNYRYQPAYRRTDIVRRRVRKDPLEDEKCEAVANLLIQGKAGERLETEIKEQIATTSPEVSDSTGVKLVVKRGRRRRKETPGELSKGAIRAQKAAARAKAMRESWMESGFLIASSNPQGQLPNRYDAAQQQQQAGGRVTRSMYASGQTYHDHHLMDAMGQPPQPYGPPGPTGPDGMPMEYMYYEDQYGEYVPGGPMALAQAHAATHSGESSPLEMAAGVMEQYQMGYGPGMHPSDPMAQPQHQAGFGGYSVQQPSRFGYDSQQDSQPPSPMVHYAEQMQQQMGSRAPTHPTHHFRTEAGLMSNRGEPIDDHGDPAPYLYEHAGVPAGYDMARHLMERPHQLYDPREVPAPSEWPAPASVEPSAADLYPPNDPEPHYSQAHTQAGTTDTLEHTYHHTAVQPAHGNQDAQPAQHNHYVQGNPTDAAPEVQLDTQEQDPGPSVHEMYTHQTSFSMPNDDNPAQEGTDQPVQHVGVPGFAPQAVNFGADVPPHATSPTDGFYQPQIAAFEDQQPSPIDQPAGDYPAHFPIDYAPVVRPADIVTGHWMRDSTDAGRGETTLAGPSHAQHQATDDGIAPEDMVESVIPFLDTDNGPSQPTPPQELDFGDKGHLFGSQGELFGGALLEKDADLQGYEEALRSKDEAGLARRAS